jgi:hypothetical protein
MHRALAVLRALVVAAVLAAASDPALAGAEDRGQAAADVAHPLGGEAANVKGFFYGYCNDAFIGDKKLLRGGVYYARI